MGGTGRCGRNDELHDQGKIHTNKVCMGFEALHGEVSMYTWFVMFVVTPCVNDVLAG